MLLRLIATLSFIALALAQTHAATIQLTLHDPDGAMVGGCVELINLSRDVHQRECLRAGETFVARQLPQGTYSFSVVTDGFSTKSGNVLLRGDELKSIHLALTLAVVKTEVQAQSTGTLLDATGASGQRLSSSTVSEVPAAGPGRTILQAVQTQPGWLLEANGVLHPRGSEYDTLFVVDGLPITSNRSPAFAPATALNDVYALQMSASGYSAELGHHLGGVVEVTTAAPRTDGAHGDIELQQGSFSTEASGCISYGRNRTAVFLGVDGFTTSRYLDPPVERNFTNDGLGHSVTARFDHQFGSDHSLRFWFTNGATQLQVPNETVQQLAGQRQNRHLIDSAGYASYDGTLTKGTLLSARFMARDDSATLTSNANSTPILPAQDRGVREEYASLSIATQHGGHDFKAGAQFSHTHLREQFSFSVTDPTAFDDDVPAQFAFAGAHSGHSDAFFAEDRYHLGRWTLSAGLRWDRYTMLVRDSAWSPRLALAYYARSLGLVLHASYDRVFEEPPIENLLLASATDVLRLGREVSQIPIPLSRGDFGELGVSKLIRTKLRVDASAFLRNTRNFMDDDLLLNTGVNVPTSFARASVYGAELKLNVPHWWRFSGFTSYSYLLGRSISPVTGGLFLAGDGPTLLRPGAVFAITQDQRNTAYGVVRYDVASTVWTSAALSYGSGLPTEIDPGTSREQLLKEFSTRIVDQVDFARNRVRPNKSLDLSAGWKFWQRDQRNAHIQIDITNVANKLNLINFAGLFSGTALARPRAAYARLAYSF